MLNYSSTYDLYGFLVAPRPVQTPCHYDTTTQSRSISYRIIFFSIERHVAWPILCPQESSDRATMRSSTPSRRTCFHDPTVSSFNHCLHHTTPTLHGLNMLSPPGRLYKFTSIRDTRCSSRIRGQASRSPSRLPVHAVNGKVLVPRADIGWLPGRLQRVVCTLLKNNETRSRISRPSSDT